MERPVVPWRPQQTPQLEPVKHLCAWKQYIGMPVRARERRNSARQATHRASRDEMGDGVIAEVGLEEVGLEDEAVIARSAPPPRAVAWTGPASRRTRAKAITAPIGAP